ncbi:MAG: amidohydrolase [Thermoclostridium sp.]|nr:amidohydrolase [Thermoclostridium sp.]
MGYRIENVTVVTAEEHAVKVIRNATVLTEGDRIIYIGENPPPTQHHTVINGKGKALVPGLVNAHTHVPMTLLRSYADDMSLHTWLYDHIFPIEDKMTEDDIYWGSQLAFLEMLAGGTTCFCDMYVFIDRIAEAIEACGMRALLSRGLIYGNQLEDYSNEEKLKEAVSTFRQWNGAGDGRIKIALAPHAIYTCAPAYIRTIRDTAQKLGARIHTHVDETSREHSDCLSQYGKTPVQHLTDIGLFDIPTIAAHCVHVTEEDLDIMKQKNVTLAHNPGSNLKLGSGIAPVPAALRKGVNVALGTDGASSNNNLNMWEEINLAALIHKGVSQDPLAVNADQAFTMATVNGANALGFDHSGQIRQGYQADMVLLNLSKPHYMPEHNLVSNLAYAAQASDVETVFVGGKILYDRGEYKTLDKERILHEISCIFQKLF